MDTLKYKRYFIKVKRALFGQKNRELLIFLFFFLVSASFWLLQTLNETFDLELHFPLKLENVPSNIVITSDLPTEAKIMVRDKGTVLLRYVYGKDVQPVVLDYKSYDKGISSGRVIVPAQEILKTIQTRFLSSTKIVQIKPDTLEYYFNRGARKKVPVRLVGKVETSPEYYLKDINCKPDSVVVFAPLDILDTITTAYTMRVDVLSLSADTQFVKRLSMVRGAKFVPSQIDVSLGVDLYTEKTVEVPVVGVNFPASKDLRTFPSKVKVSFRVGMSRFKQITADDFVLAVSYEELMNNKNSKVHLRLKSKPVGVSNVKIEPQEVDYLIEQLTDE